MKIEVECERKPPLNFLISNNIIDLSVIKRVYPSAAGLTFMQNSKTYYLNPSDESIEKYQVIPGIYKYKVWCINATSSTPLPLSLSKKQKSQYLQVLSALEKETPAERQNDMKKHITDEKIGIKKRKLKIIWQHRDKLDSNFYKMPGRNELNLDGNKMYEVKEIKELAIAAYKSNLNSKYFESTIVELANKDLTPILEFSNIDGDKGLWKYLKRFTDKAHRASLYLLTTNTEHHTDKSVCKVLQALENKPMSDVKEQSENKDSFTLKNYPDCNFLFKTPVITASSITPKSIGDMSSWAVPSIPSPVYSKAIPPIAIRGIPSESVFKEPATKNRKVLLLEDINKLKVPLVTEIPLNDLIISENILGKGFFGTVRRGLWSECIVAIKTMDTIYQEPKEIIKEVAILRQITHKNIVSIMGVCNQDTEFHIVMEFVDDHTLKDAIFKQKIREKLPLTLEEKYVIAIDICGAITFLHQHPLRIIHRDIKPGNIMLTSRKEVKVCDLGLAKFRNINSQLQSTKGKKIAAGTPLFMAPEVYLHYMECSGYIDVWSVACTLVEFFSENQPWKLNMSLPRFNLQDMLINKEIPCLEDIPDCLIDLFVQCFDYEYTKRRTAKEIFLRIKNVHSSLYKT